MQVSNNYNNISNNCSNLGKDVSIKYPFMPKEILPETISRDNIKRIPKNLISVPNLYNPKLLLTTFASPQYIQQLIDQNPNIEKILSEKGLPVKIYPANVLNIRNSHLQMTKIIANQLADKLGISQSEKQILEQAATFHDFGKVLIPDKVLNKPSSLTPEEREIVDLHSQLGYELLKGAGINKRTLNLIKNHHTPNKTSDTLCQILSVADIYSALRERRSYKPPLSINQSFEILDQKAQDGEVSMEVVNVLKQLIQEAA